MTKTMKGIVITVATLLAFTALLVWVDGIVKGLLVHDIGFVIVMGFASLMTVVCAVLGVYGIYKAEEG